MSLVLRKDLLSCIPGQHNKWGERPQIGPAPRDKASSSVITSSAFTKPEPVSKPSGPKQRIAWTKPFSTEQRETLINAVVGKMKQESARQGYSVSESTLQEIASEQLSHCRSMQDVMMLGKRLQEKSVQLSDELPHYAQTSHSLGYPSHARYLHSTGSSKDLRGPLDEPRPYRDQSGDPFRVSYTSSKRSPRHIPTSIGISERIFLHSLQSVLPLAPVRNQQGKKENSSGRYLASAFAEAEGDIPDKPEDRMFSLPLYNKLKGVSVGSLLEKHSFSSLRDEEVILTGPLDNSEGSGVFGTIGRFGISAVAAMGRGINRLEREHPDKVAAVRAYIEATGFIQEVGVRIVAKTTGTEKEIEANKKLLGKAFEDAQKDLAKYCRESGISKEDQAGIATSIAYCSLLFTKFRKGAKVVNNVQRSDNLLTSPIKEAAKHRQQNIKDGIPGSVLGPSGKPKIHEIEYPTRKKAKDGATNNGNRGQPPKHHPNPTEGESPHFHPSGRNRREHHAYPTKGFPRKEKY